jgi:hypothetical protein
MLIDTRLGAYGMIRCRSGQERSVRTGLPRLPGGAGGRSRPARRRAAGAWES